MFFVALVLTALMILVDILAHGDALVTTREGVGISILILFSMALDYIIASAYGLRKRFGPLSFVTAPVTIPFIIMERILRQI